MTISVVISIAMASAFAAAAWKELDGDARRLFYAPIALVWLAIAAIHGLVPTLAELSGFSRYSTSYSSDARIVASVTVIIYAASMAIGHDVLGRRAVWGRWRMRGDAPEKVRFVSLVVSCVFLVSAGLVTTRIFALGVAEFFTDRINYSESFGIAKVVAQIGVLIPALIWASYRSKSRTAVWLKVLSAAGLAIAYFSLIGSRQSVFLTLMILALTTLGATERRVPIRGSYVAVVLLAVVSFALLGPIRRELTRGVAPTASVMTLVDGLSGGLGNHENVLWLHENWDGPYMQGDSYVAGLVAPIPRAMWPGKPLGGGPTLKNLIAPGSYELGVRGASSVTTGSITEAYMNLGWFGVIIVGFGHGLAMGWLRHRGRGVTDSLGLVLHAVLVFLLGIAFLYSEFLGWFAKLVVLAVPLVVFRAFPAGAVAPPPAHRFRPALELDSPRHPESARVDARQETPSSP